ncbi:hypothetical protein AtEden1_Chr3g0166511 [Arabidopsis thaliana]
MGNCLVMEKKVIKIMRNDGKVVEYRGPMKVHHILTQFSPHYSLFDSLTNNCHLHPQAKLLCGRLYYLEDDEESQKSNGVVRVKMVVSKQELEKLLQGGSVHEMVYRTLAKATSVMLIIMIMLMMMSVIESGNLC